MTKRDSSRTAASLGLVLNPLVASPIPVNPSSVRTLTNSQFFQGLPTTKV